MVVLRARTFVWPTNNNGNSLLTQNEETSADGLRRWSTAFGRTNQALVYYGGSGGKTITNINADGSYTINQYANGRLTSVTLKDSAGSQLGQTTYGYDPHRRQNSITDARNGGTTNYFSDSDRISAILTPAPGIGQQAQLTTNYFDSMDRVWKTTLPDNTSTTNEFYLTGLLKKTSGSRTYPVDYTYDSQGRMKTMKTWQNFAADTGTAVTTWNYDSYRGFLTNKVYAGGTAGASYTYTAAGRLQTRGWARGITTTFSYNNAGELQTVDYSDSTPDAAYVYDRLGRPQTVTQGTNACNYSYADSGQLLSESTTGGILAGLSITNGYDGVLRRTNLVAQSSTIPFFQHSMSYGAASRLQTVTDGTNSATYSYLANSPLVSQITFQQSGSTKMTMTKQYDYLNRLLSISSAPAAAGQSPLSYAYAYNNANQRTAATNADNSRWVYTYDSLGQVTSGKKYWADGVPVAGQQFAYGFDDIGNRASTQAGGDQYGANVRYASYAANTLNQYTSRTVPGAVDLIGSATNTATVTVNNQPTWRKGDYYWKELSLENTTAPVFPSVTNLAVLNNGTNADIVTNITGTIFLPSTPESFGYDADGNTTNDGRWSFTWDGENHLVRMEALSTVPSGAKKKLDFAYDFQGRRIQKIVSTWNGSAYVAASTNKFLYDAWNLIAEFDSTNGVIGSYMWGLDLSGTPQGAGGVGGLLRSKPTAANALFIAYDGNGNVTGLIDATTGTTSGQFEYGPFGETIRASGAMATNHRIRFSTKYTDDESDFLYYGFRYYNPSTGRWLSRDPIEEQGGLNLYCFVRNAAVVLIDRDGRQPTEAPAASVQVQTVVGKRPSVMDLIAGGSGEISQPAFAGSLTFTQFPSGISSDLTIGNWISRLTGGGRCNTVTGPDGNVTGSGGLIFSLKATPGTYHVDVQATLKMDGEGPNGRARFKIFDGSGGIILEGAGTTKQPYHNTKVFPMTVVVGGSGEATILRYSPSIGLNDCCSKGHAVGSFKIIGVK